MKRKAFSNAASVAGQCLCGAVRFEFDYPAFWAWHDHSRASRFAPEVLSSLRAPTSKAFAAITSIPAAPSVRPSPVNH